MTQPRISHALLRIARDRVQMIVDELNACHPDDNGRRNRLTEQLREAERSLQDKREMVVGWW